MTTTDGFNFAKDPLVTLAELHTAALRCMLVCNNKLLHFHRGRYAVICCDIQHKQILTISSDTKHKLTFAMLKMYNKLSTQPYAD